MAIKKKYPKCEQLPPLDNDSRQNPSNDSRGWYTSMDIVKIFPEIKMDALQEWFKRELVRPNFATEGPTGWIKHFNRSGLCMLAMFKRLVDLGIPRARIRAEMLRFHSARVAHVKRFGTEPDFILLEIENKTVVNLTTTTGDFELKRDTKDIAVINFYRILFKIDSYTQ